jgi:hypothetical protein
VSTAPILLCEGEHDEAFFGELIKARNLPAFDIRKADQADEGQTGIGGFKMRLDGLAAEPGIEDRQCIILVADSDDSPHQNFLLVKKQIKKTKWFCVPNNPGVIARTGRRPPVMVLMLPDNNTSGCLETLLFISAGEKRLDKKKCVEKYIECIDATRWTPSKLAKLRMRVLISGSCPTDPYTGMQWLWTKKKGRAVDLVPLDHSCFDGVVRTLNSVFSGDG